MSCMRRRRSKNDPGGVRASVIHENQTESMRLLMASGLECFHLFLKSTEAPVSENSEGATRARAKGERNGQIIMGIKKARTNYQIAREQKNERRSKP